MSQPDPITGTMEIQLESGVSAFTGEPFCMTRVYSDGRLVASGQATPDQMRAQGQMHFEVAEAAETDSLLMALLREDVHLDEQQALLVLQKIRDRRGR